MLKITLKIYFRLLLEFKYLKFRVIDMIAFKEKVNYLKSNSKPVQNVYCNYMDNIHGSIINYDFITLNEHCMTFNDDLNRNLNHEFNLLGSGW